MERAYLLFKEQIVKANTVLPESVKRLIEISIESEEDKKARERLKILLKNAEIAEREKRPICQDTGVLNVFLFLPEGVPLPKGLENTVNLALRDAYLESGFRLSTVNPPVIERKNTGDNRPAFLKVMDSGLKDTVKMVFMPKGGGSENASFIKMFKPSTAIDSVIEEISRTVAKKAMFSCPPVIVGLSFGGTFDSAPLKAKISLLEAGKFETELGRTIRERVNSSQVGPFGLGGSTTVLAVTTEFEPTHIASLPVAVCMSCHALRYSVLEVPVDEWVKMKFEVI